MKILHGPNFLNKYLLPSFHHKPLAVSDVDAGTGGSALQGAARHVVVDGGLLLADGRGILDGSGHLVDGVVDDEGEPRIGIN